MQSIPEKLCEQVSSLGFNCYTHENHHFIGPKHKREWYLIYQRGYWVLVIKDVPQMNLNAEEVLKFLNRLPATGMFSRGRQSASIQRELGGQPRP